MDDKGVTVVEVDRASGGEGELAVEGDKLVWSFDVPDRKQPSPIGKPATRQASTIAREEIPTDIPKVTTNIHDGEDVRVETVGGEQAGFTSTLAAQAAGRYGGRRIDLDLKDADIHNVLRLLADVGKVNIVTADDVSGNVTIRMRNVPWDQALDVVLQAKGLGMVRQGNLIRVAPAATLQKERRAAPRRGEAGARPRPARDAPHPGELRDGGGAAGAREGPPISARIDRRRRAHQRAHRARRERELEPHRGTRPRPRHADAAGARRGPHRRGHEPLPPATSASSGAATRASVRRRATPPASPSPRASASSAQLRPQNTPTAGLSPFQRVIPNPNFAVNLPAATGTGRAARSASASGSIDNSVNLAVRLSAAEASGLVRIVSSPRILTLDNRQARINQGTLIPFSQISAQGVQTTFQEAKLQLLVTPHVTADGSIAMHVKINRDEPDFNQTSARGDPTILKREAETDLLVMTGTPRSSAASSRATPGATRPGAVLRRHPGARCAVPAAPGERHAQRARDLHHARIVNRAEALGR
jgi:type IV pilus assembly protein PilQ